MRTFKFFHFVLAGLFLLGNLGAYGQGFINNPHKFDKNNWDFDQRCNPCHIYNPEAKATSSDGYFVSYESDSLTAKDSVYISSVSKLCLNCHDGAVAVSGQNTRLSQAEAQNTGIHFSHPVSVKYSEGNMGKTRLFNPNTTLSGMGNTISEDMLRNGRIECTSCHDAHFSMELIACSTCPPVTPRQMEINGFSSLWKTNRKSALCLTCHNL